MSFPEWQTGQANPEVPVTAAFDILKYLSVYGRDPDTTSNLTWGYLGGGWLGFSVTAGTLTLGNNATNYIVVERSTGTPSVSTSNTNWNNTSSYARVFQITTSSGLVVTADDHRARTAGIFAPAVGGGGGSSTQAICIAVSDETTAITAGTGKVTFRMPFAMTNVSVRASLTTAQATNGGGGIFTVDINEAGASILSTKITIDNTEKTSTTAATPPVVSDTSLADDAEVTIDVDQVGDGTATGLKVYITGTV